MSAQTRREQPWGGPVTQALTPPSPARFHIKLGLEGGKVNFKDRAFTLNKLNYVKETF